MKYTVMTGNVVSNIVVADSPLDPSWQAAGNAKIGWAWDGSIYTPPMMGLGARKTEKLEELGSMAKEKSDGGIVSGGRSVGSDDDAVARITSSLSVMGRNPTEEIDFLFQNGWGVAKKPDLEAMQDAIWALRKSVSANHRAHYVAIDALLTEQGVMDYDIGTGWPS